MDTPVPPKIKRFPAADQRRLDELLEKNSQGTITAEEKVRLEELVAEAERLMVANAKAIRPGSAIGKLRIVEEDDSHLDDFREYMP